MPSAKRRSLPGCSLAVAAGLALCAADAHATFIVNQPWVRPAMQGRSTEVYMDLTSSEGATLIAARSELGIVAIRGRGKAARDKERVALPAKTMIRLAPGGYRLVLTGLARPVKLGDRVLLTLTIETAGGSRQEIPVDAEARLRSPIEDERRAHGGAH